MTIAFQLLYGFRSLSRRSQGPVAELVDLDRSRRDRHRGRRREEGDQAGRSNGRRIRTFGSHMERGPGNNSNGGVSNAMLIQLGLTRNDRLPDPVEEERTRLLERLWSVTLTNNSEPTISTKKKIPPHRWDAFCVDKEETFRNPEEKYEAGVMTDPTECCICLEGFAEGDKLIKLCCKHKFHPGCLKPWVMFSADCPLCRADISEI